MKLLFIFLFSLILFLQAVLSKTASKPTTLATTTMRAASCHFLAKNQNTPFFFFHRVLGEFLALVLSHYLILKIKLSLHCISLRELLIVIVFWAILILQLVKGKTMPCSAMEEPMMLVLSQNTLILIQALKFFIIFLPTIVKSWELSLLLFKKKYISPVLEEGNMDWVHCPVLIPKQKTLMLSGASTMTLWSQSS